MHTWLSLHMNNTMCDSLFVPPPFIRGDLRLSQMWFICSSFTYIQCWRLTRDWASDDVVQLKLARARAPCWRQCPLSLVLGWRPLYLCYSCRRCPQTDHTNGREMLDNARNEGTDDTNRGGVGVGALNPPSVYEVRQSIKSTGWAIHAIQVSRVVVWIRRVKSRGDDELCGQVCYTRRSYVGV